MCESLNKRKRSERQPSNNNSLIKSIKTTNENQHKESDNNRAHHPVTAHFLVQSLVIELQLVPFLLRSFLSSH